MTNTLYETDNYTWARQQAQLVRDGQYTDLDWVGLLEELEELGDNKEEKLEGWLTQLLHHLLKWKYQPEKRQLGHSWEISIVKNRQSINRLFRHGKNKGLYTLLPDTIVEVYPDAVRLAVVETRLPRHTFPVDCPWTAEQIMDDEFWPESVQ